jgi:hypothetical protein
MALLSASDVLIFFSLLLNCAATARPWNASTVKAHSSTEGNDDESLLDSREGRSLDEKSPNASDEGTARLLGNPPPDSHAEDGLKARCNDLLLSFRRLGVFIALWNVAMIFAMVFIFS